MSTAEGPPPESGAGLHPAAVILPERTAGGLRCVVEEHVAYLTLNRPERLNALSRALIVDLITVFDAIESRPDIWVVVLTGAGDRAFCAGVDLKEMAELDAAGIRSPLPMHGVYRNVSETVLSSTRPVIAALNGVAHGFGCELALACDIRLAASHAEFAMPEGKRGLVANFGTQLLPRLIPAGIAYELLYTGDPLSAAEAHRWGLVNRVVPGAALAEVTAGFARGIASNAPLTLQRFKANVSRGRDLPVNAALRLDAGVTSRQIYESKDRAEGVRAFVEKRAPQWCGE